MPLHAAACDLINECNSFRLWFPPLLTSWPSEKTSITCVIDSIWLCNHRTFEQKWSVIMPQMYLCISAQSVFFSPLCSFFVLCKSAHMHDSTISVAYSSWEGKKYYNLRKHAFKHHKCVKPSQPTNLIFSGCILLLNK